VQKGTVIKSTGSWYQVQRADGSTLPCRIQGKFKLAGMKLTNPVAVGDQVDFKVEAEEEEIGTIKKIHPRKNYVARRSPRNRHNLHLMASNIDQAVIIMTIVQPNLKQGFIDRFLLLTEPQNIPAYIIFNKADLYTEADMEVYEILKDIYEKIGYGVLLTSALENTGIDALRDILKDKHSLISGQSGVGKSTLINAVQPGMGLRTEEISDYSGKGQHTTTFAEMFTLDFGGFIIDSPGIKMLGFNDLEPMDVAHNFREIFEASSGCKFSNCTHRNEPKCAVKDAVEDGGISELRYLNYITIIEEIEDQNYWERNKEM